MKPVAPTTPILRVASVVCLLGCLIVFGMRARAAWVAAQTPPGIAVTSGFEEESWFALWRYAHGQPVFSDPTRVPFAGTYFNWLFYTSYGTVALQAATHASDAAIPTAGRTLTALFAIGGIAALSWSFARQGDRWVAIALSGFAFTGPLVGWWALTVRPDVAALALEALGIGLALRAMTSPGRRWIVGAALAFFAAWSFKQSFIFGLTASGGLLLWRGAWRDALWLGGVFGILAGATFLVGGPSFRSAMMHTAVVNDFYLALGLDNALGTLKKTAPLWLLPSLLLIRARTLGREALARHPAATQLCAIGLAIAFSAGTLLSCKMGASTNYLFSALPFLVGLNVIAASVIPSAPWRMAPATLAFGLQAMAVAGIAGTVSLANQSTTLAQIWDAWKTSPQPRFASVTAFNLPWVSSESPPLVLAFNYPLLRRAGVEFERGGVGGMIERREFAALLLPAADADRFDGSTLEGYVAEQRLFDFVVLRRKDIP